MSENGTQSLKLMLRVQSLKSREQGSAMRSISRIWIVLAISVVCFGSSQRVGIRRAFAADVSTFSPTRQLVSPEIRDQDDMCIWVHPKDPAKSTVIASDKSANQVVVYSLDGQVVQSIRLPKPGNIDIRQNVVIDGESMDIVVVNQRAEGFKLDIFRVTPESRELERIDDKCVTDANYGSCLYHNPKTGRLYCFCTSDIGVVGQYELKGNGHRGMKATKVRTLSVGKCEGAVADDENGYVFISEERKGVWKFAAEPDASVEGELIAPVGENGLKGDVEGLALVSAKDGGYLLVSDQGRSRYQVYRRSAPHQFVGEFAIEGATHTDGIDVSSAMLGPQYPDGVFACHTDREPRGVLLTPWGQVAAKLTQ